MNKIAFAFAGLLAVVTALHSCKKDAPEPASLQFTKAAYFPDPVYTFQNNNLYEARFQLGRKIFYDPVLSSDSTVSCATCHEQAHAFAGHGTAFSTGVNGQAGVRNSPSITNLAWFPAFMWDGGINHIEVMPIAPITNPVEMNQSIAGVLAKLNQSAAYKAEFLHAYNVQEINSQSLLRALAQFIGTIVSDRSKYDDMRKGTATFTSQEQAGYSLYQANCSSCHTEPLFTDFSYRNNGLDSVFTDQGRELITLSPSDAGKFKVPGLRNVELTYPYMHDGRFYSLNDVLDHYSSHVLSSSTLDVSLAGGIPLNDQEKSALIAFLKTLTDHQLTIDQRFSEP